MRKSFTGFRVASSEKRQPLLEIRPGPSLRRVRGPVNRTSIRSSRAAQPGRAADSKAEALNLKDESIRLVRGMVEGSNPSGPAICSVHLPCGCGLYQFSKRPGE